MHTSEIHPLPKEIFESLIETHALHCVSIYLPMDKKGQEQNLHLAQGFLKKCINEVRDTLTQHQMHIDEINKHLDPVAQLLDRVDFWRNPSDGLAIFLNPKDGMQYFKVPISFEVKTYVSSHYYLKPLLPLYHNVGMYYLLELSQDYVKLYEASRFHFKDVYVEDFAPKRLEEAVGFDHKPKMLQFRTGQNVHSAGSFHGHGEGKDDERKELVTFFRAVDKGVKKVIGHKNVPLVLVCVDHLFDIYKDASTYPELHPENLGGDPEFRGKTSLHEASWNLMEKHFTKHQSQKALQFNELYHTQKTSYEIDDILNAALHGKVDTLFIADEDDIFGTYDFENNKIITDDEKDLSNTSLTNLAAIEAFKRGGKVYVLPSNEMPLKESSMNAVFRY
ncbi:hypothetical protein [Maribacter aestuarii]|uniref:baeRF7 domain-containing protein n=1 Tax=Maribacter aestuarii TaxID=1130723 RepID=UPI00248C6232|nr:hypothetical protein [Maribacter aestuarii]